jgi:hypothetical protein
MATVKVDARDLAEGTCPPVCVRCGAPAAYSRTVTVSCTGEGNAAADSVAGALFGGAGRFATAAAATETARIILPVCPVHARPRGLPDERGQARIGFLLFGVMMTTFFGLLVIQQLPPTDFPWELCVLGTFAVVAVVGLVAMRRYARHVIRAVEMTDRWVILTNVSLEFAKAVVVQQEADRRARLAKWERRGLEPPSTGG